MATPTNSGGVGGPSRRRPFRRGAPSPYDRPPTALRSGREGGWISKFVDPASRLIASGASKFFSSMFRKRLTAPPSTPEDGCQSREDASQGACTIPSPELQNGGRDGDNQTNHSDSGGIAELEQLLKQKIFTRVEFDRLAELLRSRTVETLKGEHENDNEQMKKASVSAQEGGIGSSKVHESLSVPSGGSTIQKQIPKDEAASPAELAKAYMGSRPSKVSPSVESFRNQVFQEDANLPSIPSTSKRLDLSVAPRSVMRFSGIPEHLEHGYQTARPPGRSAIYRMSRSPYFKVGELSRDGHSCQSSSQWTPSAMKSSGKKVLKRGSSALDGDFGSFGPIRRIRQKFNLISPSKEVRSLLSGSSLSSPSTPLFKDVSKGSMSVQKSLLLDERNYDSTGRPAVENGLSTGTILPSQSSETAQKLFQQLDKLLPSPKGKSSELKSIAIDDSPSKLTLDMLHGSALRSMEDINSSNFFSMQGSGRLDTASASHLPNISNIHSQKLDVVEENGPLKSVGSGVKLAFGASGVSNASIPSKDAKPGVTSENMPIANSVARPVPKRPAFQMSAPEDSLELGDDDERDLSSPLTTAKDDADTKMFRHNNVISEAAISENPPTTSQNVPVSSSISFRKADKKAPTQPVITEKANGFAFPVASDPCTQSQPPPTPTMPNHLLVRPDAQKEQTSSPIFSFGSKDTKSPIFSSATISVNDAAGVECGIGSRSDPTLTTSANTSVAEGSILEESKPQNAGDIFKSSGNTVSSGMSTLSTPASVFAFGASPASSLSNGLPYSSSSKFSAPHSVTNTVSEGTVSSILTNGIATTSSSSSSSVSSAAATFSTVPSFQFGSGISTTTVSVSQPLDKYNPAFPEENSVKASPFSISSSMSQAASHVFPSIDGSSSSDIAKPVKIFGSDGSSPALSTPLTSSGVSSFSAPSSSIPSMVGSSSSAAPSSAFPSAGSSVFGFAASTQPTGSSPSFANNSSQNSTVTTFGATGGSTISSPLFASSSADNSTASTFGATGGLVFGTQSTQSGTGTSQISQSPTGQFSSFSSSPSFGFGNSSSSSFGASPFGSVTLGAKTFPSTSAFSFTAGAGPSSANSSSAFTPAATAGPGPSSANSSSAFTPAATAGPFGSSSQASASPIFASTSGCNTSPSTGFTSGLSASVSSSTTFTFGSSSPSVFPFTSAGTTASSTSSSLAPVFGMPNPAVGFGSSSPGNDQMYEDSMTDDTNQAATALVPAFEQPANLPPAPSFVFGSPAVQPGAPSVFQFGSHQNPPVPQIPSPFQPAGVEGGSFSLGSGGGDKAGRKFVRVKRDKLRKK